MNDLEPAPELKAALERVDANPETRKVSNRKPRKRSPEPVGDEPLYPNTNPDGLTMKEALKAGYKLTGRAAASVLSKNSELKWMAIDDVVPEEDNA